ncbi:MAG TPA: AAA family ATPase [Burkholderiales bacterium]|nr:AAA family ATPase [Burkholderiales bacterium]
MPQPDTLAAPGSRFESLVAALCEPSCYPHPVRRVELVETHISCVFLTGDYAYKIKKPVDLGFLDFRSLKARLHYCQEELRLNGRTAPRLYLDVVPIAGSESKPILGGTGPAIEYAVRMRQFPQHALLDRMAKSGALMPTHIDALASEVAKFHSSIERAGSERPFGSARQVLMPAIQNFDQMRELAEAEPDRVLLEQLRVWTGREHTALYASFDARKRDGFVRECHGDLHLGNIALIDQVPTPFDCIEFNDEFRWIDVMNEVAFLTMDLIDHGLRALAFRFLNGYLEAAGDYAGVKVLRFYLVYRALVRAKVSCIRAHQPQVAKQEKAGAIRDFQNRLQLGRALSARAPRALIITHGISGSGKTSIAQTLLESLGAIRLRSDIERKRLHGFRSQARTSSGLDAGIYAPLETERTYSHLVDLARQVIAADYPAIVDAAFLARQQRERFCRLAREMAVPFVIVSCTASEAVLRERVARREREAKDASEAGLAVLQRQLAVQEPLAGDELAHALIFDSERGGAPSDKLLAALEQRLGIT